MSRWCGERLEGVDFVEKESLPFWSMTLCIAAICRKESQIVTVSDYQVNTPGIDPCKRNLPFPKFVVSPKGLWLIMFTGDTDIAFEVWRNGRERLRASGDESKNIVREIFESVCKSASQKKHNELAYFASIGKPCPAAVRSEFIVAGFDTNKQPRLFLVSEAGVFWEQGESGFVVIGIRGESTGATPNTVTIRTSLPVAFVAWPQA